ncbi:unnamed protein product [Closterium sp. Yama58-4]|nr:unnamed protein product [Closterium sp. Yama58-4]
MIPASSFLSSSPPYGRPGACATTAGAGRSEAAGCDGRHAVFLPGAPLQVLPLRLAARPQLRPRASRSAPPCSPSSHLSLSPFFLLFPVAYFLLRYPVLLITFSCRHPSPAIPRCRLVRLPVWCAQVLASCAGDAASRKTAITVALIWCLLASTLLAFLKRLPPNSPRYGGARVLRTATADFVLMCDAHVVGHAAISAVAFTSLGFFTESVRQPLFPGVEPLWFLAAQYVLLLFACLLTLVVVDATPGLTTIPFPFALPASPPRNHLCAHACPAHHACLPSRLPAHPRSTDLRSSGGSALFAASAAAAAGGKSRAEGRRRAREGSGGEDVRRNEGAGIEDEQRSVGAVRPAARESGGRQERGAEDTVAPGGDKSAEGAADVGSGGLAEPKSGAEKQEAEPGYRDVRGASEGKEMEKAAERAEPEARASRRGEGAGAEETDTKAGESEAAEAEAAEAEAAEAEAAEAKAAEAEAAQAEAAQAEAAQAEAARRKQHRRKQHRRKQHGGRRLEGRRRGEEEGVREEMTRRLVVARFHSLVSHVKTAATALCTPSPPRGAHHPPAWAVRKRVARGGGGGERGGAEAEYEEAVQQVGRMVGAMAGMGLQDHVAAWLACDAHLPALLSATRPPSPPRPRPRTPLPSLPHTPPPLVPPISPPQHPPASSRRPWPPSSPQCCSPPCASSPLPPPPPPPAPPVPPPLASPPRLRPPDP